MKKALLLLLLSLQLFSSQALKEIVIVSEEWKDMTNADGTGIYFDILKAIYEPLDIKVKIKIAPYNRSTLMVKNKTADVWLGSYIDEEDFAIYPKHYFDQDTITAMFKTAKFPTFNGVQTLKNRNVGWIRGYGYDEYIDIKMNILERNNRKSILLSLEKDRFDIFLDDKYDMQEAIEQAKFDTSKYSFVELLKFKLYPAFRDDERGKKLREIWDSRFKELLNDGSMKKLYIKHDFQEYFLY